MNTEQRCGYCAKCVPVRCRCMNRCTHPWKCIDTNCPCHRSSHTEQKGWRERFIEEAAALEHARWARWQKYLHSKCDADAFGNLTIPRDSVVHWIRQIETPYHNLSEQEKESDRKEVLEYLPLIERTLQEQREEMVRRIADEKEKWGPCYNDLSAAHVDGLTSAITLIKDTDL